MKNKLKLFFLIKYLFVLAYLPINANAQSNDNKANSEPKNNVAFYPKEIYQIQSLHNKIKDHSLKEDKKKILEELTDSMQIKLLNIAPNYPEKHFLPIEKSLLINWSNNHPNEINGYKDLLFAVLGQLD